MVKYMYKCLLGSRDKWGRFFFVPKGHLRTVPKCPKGTKKNRPHLSLSQGGRKNERDSK